MIEPLSLVALLITIGAAHPHDFVPTAVGRPLGGPTDTVPSARQFFVGRWSCVGGTPAGRVMSSDVSFTPVLGGQFIQMHHRDRPPGRYEAIALWPTADTSMRAGTTVYDNFGGVRRFTTAPQTQNGVVLERDTLDAGARFETFTFRRMTDSTYWYAWHVRRTLSQPASLGDSATCRRIP